MRAIEIDPDAGGTPEALVPTDREVPTPEAGEVLVEVVAAGVNRADVAQRQGNYPPPPGASDLPGLEVSGRVVAFGPGTEGYGFAEGDEVCALLTGGGYAEYVAVPVGQLLPVPDEVDLRDAAALPEVAATVWSNLVMEAGLRQGETVLLHGGSSGIGTMGIQIAKALGATVAVTAGSAEKLRACAELGADIGINYREQDFTAELKAATDGRGADVILDLVGAPYLTKNIRALAPGGRIVTIGIQGGRKGEIDLGIMLVKRLRLIVTSLRSRPAEEKAEIVRQVRDHVWPWFRPDALHRIRPVIHARYPLAEAAAAHREMESSGHIGKILLDVR